MGDILIGVGKTNDLSALTRRVMVDKSACPT